MINRACYFYSFDTEHKCIIKNISIDNCDSRCKFFQLVSASPLFVNKMDVLHRNAQKLKPVDGFIDIVSHGTSLYLVNKTADGKQYNISPQEFAQIIKVMYTNEPIPNLRLIACCTGALEDGVAQILSNELGVIIKAPIGAVVVDFFGNMYVEGENNTELYGEAGWKLFYPKMKKEGNEWITK